MPRRDLRRIDYTIGGECLRILKQLEYTRVPEVWKPLLGSLTKPNKSTKLYNHRRKIMQLRFVVGGRKSSQLTSFFNVR